MIMHFQHFLHESQLEKALPTFKISIFDAYSNASRTIAPISIESARSGQYNYLQNTLLPPS
jgi:hypothetical protein